MVKLSKMFEMARRHCRKWNPEHTEAASMGVSKRVPKGRAAESQVLKQIKI